MRYGFFGLEYLYFLVSGTALPRVASRSANTLPHEVVLPPMAISPPRFQRGCGALRYGCAVAIAEWRSGRVRQQNKQNGSQRRRESNPRLAADDLTRAEGETPAP